MFVVLPLTSTVYISWLTYVVVLCLLKVSLVLFYLEIFVVIPRFKTFAYLTLAFILINSVVVLFVTIFACRPISLFWNRDIKNGTCINVQALAYTISGSALVQDIMLLVLPLCFICKLQIKRHRKIAISLMFAVGTFGAVATLMRLPSLSTFKISIDPTWDYVPMMTWSQLELAACFICVSLPSIRILFAKIVPTTVKDLFSSILRSSRSNSAQIPSRDFRITPDIHQEQDHDSSNPTRSPSNYDKGAVSTTNHEYNEKGDCQEDIEMLAILDFGPLTHESCKSRSSSKSS